MSYLNGKSASEIGRVNDPLNYYSRLQRRYF